MSDPILLDGRHLTLSDIEAVARGAAGVRLAPEARAEVERASKAVLRMAAGSKPVYGVNTGFGIFATRRIDRAESARLSRNLVLSHSAGVGPPFDRDLVRAAMLIRANTFAHGYSGVRPELIDTLLAMLERDLTPWIPSQGSLGSSGDLAPLAHLAMILSQSPDETEDGASGRATYRGALMTGNQAMEAAGIQRLVLGPKEGLALTNGATFAAGILALACRDAERLLLTAEVAAAMSFEALLGTTEAYDARLHRARLHPGQEAVAARLLLLTQGSSLVDSSDRIQDAYSLRCVPQIVGPAWEILEFVKEVVTREVNAATDNPLLFGETALSGGNFHGEPIGLAADYLKIALAEVGAVSERRLFRLVSDDTNAGLPPMLVAERELAGLHSGMMMAQYTAASLVLENQALAAPNTVHSLPTSAGQEDLNANATTATRRLRDLTGNLAHILAIELLAAAQALDLRLRGSPEVKLGLGTSAAHHAVRQSVPFIEADRPLDADFEAVLPLIRSGALLKAVEDALR